MWLRRIAATVVLWLVASPAATATEATGTLDVRVTDRRAGIGDFAALHVALAEVGLHPRRAPRGQGWVPAPGRTAAVDLVPLKDGRFVRLGVAEAPAGRYNAVRVRFAALEGALRSGARPFLRAVPSTAAVELTVTTDRPAVILADLYVEDVSDHDPGHYLVKVKGVTSP